MIKKRLLSCIFLICNFLAISTFSQNQNVESDSSATQTSSPFRKGRWLTGLSGSIGSGSTENKSTSIKSISNNYRVEISSGKFAIDRLNIGLTSFIERNNIEEENVEEITSEIFFLGPKTEYFLSDNSIGSVFFRLSPGYTLYRDKTGKIENNIYVEKESKGGGFGLLTTFGFAYAVADRVIFDLGLNFNVFWLDIKQKDSITSQVENINFELNNVSFSFGFKILIDKKPL